MVFSSSINEKDFMSDGKLLVFVKELSLLLEEKPSEAIIFTKGKKLLEKLIASDDWLPEAFAVPHPQYYQQYLLYADPLDRFSIVSFVWGPGQKTPVHNHTVWGMVGQLRGEEKGTPYYRQSDGCFKAGESTIASPGHVDTVSPNTHDIHVVENHLPDQTSISIHVYGGNIGKIQRSVFDPATGAEKSFVSGYANTVVPNLWKSV
jgi:predicted metal-dependent enzyme (double-stranded beta helix superfamily)